MQKYISYYRVSTTKQGLSGLGLEAQKSAVHKFINNCTECVVAEFTDIESGKNNNRPELQKAINEAQKHKAHLLIAKLDRLSRNASFIFMLRDAKIDFTCCDMPQANSITIGIMAVLAQDERERISQRTKAALLELKKKGIRLGNPRNLNIAAIEKGRLIRKENARSNENNRKASALIASLRMQGTSFYEITKRLNSLGFKARRGGAFSQNQVQILFNRK